MKKRIFIIAVILFILLAFVFRGVDITVLRVDDVVTEEYPEQGVMAEPFPVKGDVVAVINGAEYRYDEEYLLLLDPEKYLYGNYSPESLSEDFVKQLVLRELYALEADVLGLDEMDAENPDYETDQAVRATYNGGVQWILNADPAIDPSAADIPENRRKQALRYIELRDLICAEQNISAEELWIWADAYICKNLKIQAYEAFVYECFCAKYGNGDMFRNFDLWAQYRKAADKALMKKYDTEILYEE